MPTTSVAQYVKALPPERRKVVEAVRRVINEHLPDGYVENMSYGMIAWSIPLADFPDTYNGQPLMFAGLASQKTGISLHLVAVYGDAKLSAWFQDAWKRSGHKLDMGKGCVRFRSLEDVPLEVVGEVIARVPARKYIESHVAARKERKR